MSWVDEAVAAFGVAARAKLAGPGDREAAIRAPLEALIAAAGSALRLTAVPHDEVRDTDRAVRPDYAIGVNGAITGYVEVKKPGLSVEPATFTGHNKQQWERQQDLPNLIYTNGTEWRLYRDGELKHGPLYLTGGTLETAGRQLTPPAGFEMLLTDFLRWHPETITSVKALVRAIAPLTRLLRGEVLDQLRVEQAARRAGGSEEFQPFTGLARDWRAMLFPTASDAVFADGYAQAVTFSLLLARTEGLALDGSLHEVGARLGAADHTLMGRALQLLTDNVAADFRVTLDLLVRVIGAVAWPQIRTGRRDTYLHLYEHFLDVYDPELRKKSGSYYTPHQVVEEMVRLAEEALASRLGKAAGFADPTVRTVDPAMGTGTYLQTIIDRVAQATSEREGPGLIPATITDLVARLIGFELQMGPYAVAELRANDLLRALGADAPPNGMRLYVTDTLDDPNAETTQLGSGMELIAQSRRRANEVKARTNVTVVIGNPPYRERAEGRGGWIEQGDPSTGIAAPLDAFRAEGNGLAEYVLKNLYVYFWRWATWKVFDPHPGIPGDDRAGLVCFISTSGYVRGPGFKGMREYLRRTCSEGWIIDLTPEGQTPDVPTRIFPGVRQPLAIGLFARPVDCDETIPATVRYRAVRGRQRDKFDQLVEIMLDDGGWRAARNGWQAPFTPAPASNWDDFPALNDVFPWTTPGVKPNRTWVYAPSPAILADRWRQLTAETDAAKKAELFKPSDDSALDQAKEPLPGNDTFTCVGTLSRENSAPPAPIRIAYRSFDRQWLIPDHRLIDRARKPLWQARIPGQLFITEQHSKEITDGPGIVVTSLIPDMDAFNNRGGRVLPLLHPAGRPNVARGLLAAVAAHTGALLDGSSVEPLDLVAYLAAVIAHPAYTETFADELTTPGIRVPLTADPDLWAEGVKLGHSVLWAHTYGATCIDPAAGRPKDDVRFPNGDVRRIRNLRGVTGMPAELHFDEDSGRLHVGTGEWAPVSPAVAGYAVGGKNVIKSWFNYRKAVPGGKKTSPLDHLHLDQWPAAWSAELTDLLSVLTRLVEAEASQADLLDRILTGPLLTKNTLAAAGVRWPATAVDHKPNFRPPEESEDDAPLQLNFG